MAWRWLVIVLVLLQWCWIQQTVTKPEFRPAVSFSKPLTESRNELVCTVCIDHNCYDVTNNDIIRSMANEKCSQQSIDANGRELKYVQCSLCCNDSVSDGGNSLVIDKSPYKVVSIITTSKVLENRKQDIQYFMHTYFNHHIYSERSYIKEDTAAKIIQKLFYVALMILCACLWSYPAVAKSLECYKGMHYDNLYTTSKRTKIISDRTWSLLFRFNGISRTTIQTFPFSINPYVNEIVKDHKSPNELMRYEWARYLSFKTFPLESVMMPMRLSQAGFYYTGRREEVKCFCCGMTNADWRTGETAIEVHKRLSPNCKFICRENTDNVEIHGKEYYNGMFDVTNNISGVSVSRPEAGASGGPTDTVGQPSGDEINRNNIRSEKNNIKENGHPAKPEQRQKESRKQASANSDEDISSMKHPDYATLEAREASFMTWTQLDIQDPVELAEAGFFYTGVQDFVRCYSCGVGLKNWERGDKPWAEHERWAHSCRHLLNSRGAQGPSEDTPTRGRKDEPGSVGSPEIVSSRSTVSQKNTGACGTGRDKDTSASGSVKTSNANGPDKNTGASGSADMDSPAVRSLIEMGYSQEQVLEAIQIFRQTHNSQPVTATALVELLESAPSSSEAASHSPSTSQSLVNPSTANPSITHKESESIVPKQSPKRNLGNCSRGDAKSLIEENRSLRTQLQCKICMDNDANVVFLPCGHMVACQTCAVSLRKCAVCRKLIKGSVRVFQ